MTNPNDPRQGQPGGPGPYGPGPNGPGPFDAPTEKFGDQNAGYPQGGNYTNDPTEAYGSPPANPTMAYPTAGYPVDGQYGSYPAAEPYDPNRPPYNSTQAFPTYDAQYGGDPYGQQGGYPPPGGPGGHQPPGSGQQPPRKNKVGMWIAVAVAAVLVVAAGVGAALLFGGGGSDDSSNTASNSSVRPTPSRAPTTPGSPSTADPTFQFPTGLQLPSGLPDIAGLGAALGTITSNDGSTIEIDSIDGSTVTVRTDSDTQIISLNGSNVSDLKVGNSIAVQGDSQGDNEILAKVIVDTAIDVGGFGN
ncbi:hypothetical protein JGU71_11470 [Antrihabitans sp. YC3-6]|uniref:DUF5666 domain-containing protein n=1 Tax=Antrihabitans stalagmiti TaxID=2799499 RepID=A0A934NQD5_9NOCA|nr:DUF5666 domain-containing protein [Antrihabitans stalagmiti]MBJ8339506.1 hypothetical protein [Antrihabitans stalagmiti]